MALAKVPTAHKTVEIEGALFDVRPFTRQEQADFQRRVDAGIEKDELEILLIAAATDTPLGETEEWYRHTPGYAVEALIVEIKGVSRLADEEAQKSGGATDSPGEG